MTQPAEQAALSLAGVSFFRGERCVLDAVSWQVQAGQAAAVVGANGCGKSTLLRLVAGYLWPTRGEICVLGHRFGEYSLPLLRQQLGVVEAAAVYPFDQTMTALDVVASGFHQVLSIAYDPPSDAHYRRAAEALAQVGLADAAAQPYAQLSTGQRMRALIARALVRAPGLLLLDEPATGLDLPAREMLLATLEDLHKRPGAPAIIMVTHHLEELLPATANVLLLDLHGAVRAAGAPAAVLTQEHLTAAYRWPIVPVVREGRFHAHASARAWPRLVDPL